MKAIKIFENSKGEPISIDEHCGICQSDFITSFFNGHCPACGKRHVPCNMCIVPNSGMCADCRRGSNFTLPKDEDIKIMSYREDDEPKRVKVKRG